MNILCYMEDSARIEKVRVIGGHVFELEMYNCRVKAYKSFGAALDAISKIKGKSY